MNNQRLVNISFVGVAVVAFLFVRQLVDTLWGVARLAMPQDWPLAPADLIAVLSAIIIFVIFKKHQKVNSFTNEVITELSKVTWPQKKETLLSAVVVSIMVAICAVILFAFDMLWGTVVKLLYQ